LSKRYARNSGKCCPFVKVGLSLRKSDPPSETEPEPGLPQLFLLGLLVAQRLPVLPPLQPYIAHRELGILPRALAQGKSRRRSTVEQRGIRTEGTQLEVAERVATDGDLAHGA